MPPKIEQILKKNKVIEETNSLYDRTYWFKPPDEYVEPIKITTPELGYEMHIGPRGPYLLRKLLN